MELVSPIDGEAVVVLSPRAAKPALPSARKGCDPDVIGRLVSLYQGGLEPAHPRLPRSPRSFSGSPKRPRPKVRLPPLAIPTSPEQRQGTWDSSGAEAQDTCLLWTQCFVPDKQVFRSDVVTVYFEQERASREWAHYRKEKRDQCSDTCRRMAHRWQKQQRRKASPGAGMPAASAAANESKATLLSVEIPPSPQAPSDISSVEDLAKSPSFKPTPTPTPRVLRFQALCAAKRRQGRLNLNPSSVAQLQEEYLKQQQLRRESAAEESGSEDSGATSPTDSWPLLARSESWSVCLTLSRKHKVPVQEVRNIMSDFQLLDADSKGWLSREEFVEAIRLKACLPHGLPVPEYLLLKQWAYADKDDSGQVDFEEYLHWVRNTHFTQELAVPDMKERELRRIARAYNLEIMQIDRLKTVFDKFDADGSGQIDHSEFKDVLCCLLHANADDISQQMLDRYWVEADVNGDGDISFEEFVDWTQKMDFPTW